MGAQHGDLGGLFTGVAELARELLRDGYHSVKSQDDEEAPSVSMGSTSIEDTKVGEGVCGEW